MDAHGRRRRLKLPVAPERPLDAPHIDYGGKHPFEVGSSERRGRRRMQEDSLGFEPIRVVFDTSILEDFLRASINRESAQLATKVFLLMYEILPEAAKRLSEVIKVIPVQGALYPLTLDDRNNDKEVFCPYDKTGGIDGGGDLLIYVTLDRYFCGEDGSSFSTAASALSCERDQWDRPVTGSMDFCLDSFGIVTPINGLKELVESLNSGASSNDVLAPLDITNGAIVKRTIDVATHELLHVLGLTSDSLPFFRDPLTGNPLTPRPFIVTETTCSNGEKLAVLGEPSKKVIGRDVDATTGISYFEVRTPLVAQVARNHFNCHSLTGARLENSPTSADCFGSHWEERLYYSELMSAFLTTGNNNALSPLTLAFLEDSSWYQPNYESEYVQTSSFGNLAGCDFVNKPCIVDGQVPYYGEGNFCNDVLELTKEGFVLRQAFPQTCDPSHTSKAHCDLREAREGDTVTDVSRLYFPNERVKIPHTFTHAESCPIPSLQPTSCKNKDDEFIVSREYADARERNGPDSICVDVVTRDRAICLEATCNPEIGQLQITVLYGITITCQHDGQVHTLLGKAGSPNGLPFQIKCPKLSQVCPDLICPDNCSGRGVCQYDEETQVGYCDCFDENDNTTGCYTTSMDAVYAKVRIDDTVDAPEKSLGLILVIVIGLIFGLAALHIFMKIREDRMRKEKDENPSPMPAQRYDVVGAQRSTEASFRDEYR